MISNWWNPRTEADISVIFAILNAIFIYRNLSGNRMALGAIVGGGSGMIVGSFVSGGFLGGFVGGFVGGFAGSFLGSAVDGDSRLLFHIGTGVAGGVFGGVGIVVFATVGIIVEITGRYRLLPKLHHILVRLGTTLRSGTFTFHDRRLWSLRVQRTVAKAMFVGALSLLPEHIRDEFGDEPVQHFLDEWNARSSGRWTWALSEIVQMVWVAGLERMRGAWQTVTQK